MTIKAADLRQKTSDELKDRVVELKKTQFNIRFRRASGQLENTAQVRAVRREIATIKTLLGERARSAS
jgi:large subunit ribosomal protein L29